MADDEQRLRREAEIVLRVRTLCQLYSGSAASIGGGEYADDPDLLEYETKRYEKGRKETLDMAIKIADDFHRDSALHPILDMCMKANDYRFAVIIANAMKIDMIQEIIAEEHATHFTFDPTLKKLVPLPAISLASVVK
jgi:hypothetical protein